MANPSKKKIAEQIRNRLDRKGDINKPGMLIKYLAQELSLAGNSTINGPIGEAIDLLEEQGIVTVDRSGQIYNGITRTKRQRARSIKPAAPAKAPPTKKETPISTSTATRPAPTPPKARPVPSTPRTASRPPVQEHAKPAVVFSSSSDAPVINPEPITTEAQAAAPAPTPKLTAREIIAGLTAKYDELEAKYAQEQVDHAATKQQMQLICDAKQGLESEVTAKELVITGLREDVAREQATITGLQARVGSLTDSLSSGADAFEGVQAELTTARRQNGELREQNIELAREKAALEERVTALTEENELLSEQDDMEHLAARVSEIMSS